jgi:pimeloyl-ACP methyl ester carboxylesterase
MTAPENQPSRVALRLLRRETHLAAAQRLLVGRRPKVIRHHLERGRLRAQVSWAVDLAAVQVIRRLFVSDHRRSLERTPDYRRLQGGWLELSEADASQQQTFFPPPEPPEVSRTLRKRLPDGGALEDLTFSSQGYAAGRESALEMLRRYPENTRARIRHYRHPEPGHPAVIWLHGWGMGSHTVEATLCRARWLYRLGLEVYLYIQPHHGDRRPPSAGIGTSLHPSTNISRTNEAFLQSVWEIRSLLAWHRQQRDATAGVMGWSLGGYLCGLLSSVAPEIAFAIPILPIADVPALMWSKGEGTFDRVAAEAAGVTFDDYCRCMALHAPLAHQPVISTDRILLVGGRGDCIIPPIHTTVLWDHWGRPPVHWFPGGHLLQFGRRAYLRRVEAFLSGLGVLKHQTTDRLR